MTSSSRGLPVIPFRGTGGTPCNSDFACFGCAHTFLSVDSSCLRDLAPPTLNKLQEFFVSVPVGPGHPEVTYVTDHAMIGACDWRQLLVAPIEAHNQRELSTAQAAQVVRRGGWRVVGSHRKEADHAAFLAI